MVFVDTATLCLKPSDAIIVLAHDNKPVHFLLRRRFRGSLKKARLTTKTIHTKEWLWRHLNERKWWMVEHYKTDNFVEQHLRESFPNKMPLREESPLKNIKTGNLFGYIQCDIEVPENLREAFANFPPIFKNNKFGRDDIGPFMKEYTKRERLFTQSRRMLKSSYFLENGTIITSLLLFYL